MTLNGFKSSGISRMVLIGLVIGLGSLSVAGCGGGLTAMTGRSTEVEFKPYSPSRPEVAVTLIPGAGVVAPTTLYLGGAAVDGGLPPPPPPAANAVSALPTAGVAALPATLPPMPTVIATVPPTGTPRPTAVAVAALPTLPPVAQIKAGEINDNLQWENYLAYRARSAPIMGQVKDVDVSERYVIKVTDSDERPVLGARVQYFNSQSELIAEGRTYSSGETLFFPRATKAPPSETEFTVRVEKSGANKEFKLTRGTQTEWKTTLTLSAAQTPIKIDVLFLLDTTGSMGDELAQLQTNIISVSAQIAGLPGNPDTRYGLVAYRDRGDEYVTQISQFTPDVKTFQGSLNLLKAGGGGDIPEALNDGLHDALNGVEWSGDDTIKLIFLVTDAPPQLKYPGDFDYSQEMRDASKRGIKIFSLAASGLTPNGEYVLRQLAQQTMGNFIFITYQTPVPAQGQNPVDSRPGDNTNLTINKDDYQTELLDQLVVRLVRKEIAALKR